MVRFVRFFTVVALVLVTGIANAQDCATAVAPQCGGGVCAVPGDVCRPDLSTGVPACACVPTLPLGVTNLSIKLNFAKPSLDSIQLKGTVEVAPDFDPAGATVVVDVGGVVKGFTLGDKGKVKVGTDSVQIKKPKDGVSKFSVKFAKGSFATTLQDEGLVNETVSDVAVSVGTEVQLNGVIYKKLQPQTYKAKQGKTGSAK